MIYFISGHLSLTPEEFNTHYLPQIDKALEDSEVFFVVGDAKGADALAQTYLKSRGATVTVFHMFKGPRHNSGFPTRGGFTSDAARDIAMTKFSDQDIAWVRPGREKSGTQRNLDRRITQ